MSYLFLLRYTVLCGCTYFARGSSRLFGLVLVVEIGLVPVGLQFQLKMEIFAVGLGWNLVEIAIFWSEFG